MTLLFKGDVVAFDNSSNPHIAKVLKFLRTNVPRTALEGLDLSCYRQKWQFIYRAAHWCGKVQLTAFRRVGNVERAWDAAFHSF